MRAADNLQQHACERRTAAYLERATVGGELATGEVARAQVAQGGEEEERRGERADHDHLEGVEATDVIALVLEHRFELKLRQRLELTATRGMRAP
jgi:hypothetical protein